jgi:acyl-CoA synthetase (AMP-forming)/AMP-acid ligase II
MVVRSPYPDVAIPDIALAPYLLRHAERLGGKPALVDGATGNGYSYVQLALCVRRLAANLSAHGFSRGDVLALYAPNSPEYVIAMLAVWSLGGVVTTVNPLATAEELGRQLADANASLLVTAPELMAKASEAGQTAGVRELLSVGEAPGAAPLVPLLAGTAEAPAVAVQPDDLAALPYSSGTTGFPKGVMLTHRNLVANVCQFQPVIRMHEEDVVINAMPFFHLAGWAILFHMGLTNGCTLVTLPRFELEPFLRAVQDYRVTATLLVPPVVLALAKQPVVDRYDVSWLRVIFAGAAPLGEEVARTCAERIGCRVQQVYGLTETSPALTGNPEETASSKIASVGVCVPNTEGKIVDIATGAELGAGEQGEICARGPQILRGYLNRPEATAGVIDADGWFHTGDVGYVDADGYFYVVDRVKELIKYNAYQVAPAELEAVLLSHPAIADAAVIPSPDEQAGEVPKAFVVLRAEVTPDEIMAYVAERVAPYKKVRRVEITDAIPKTASGKILRRLLVQREREQAKAGVTSEGGAG